MMGWFVKIFRDIHTGIDNQTYDHGRVWSSLSFITYNVYAFISITMNHPWDAMSYATGLSAIVIGHGVNLKLKSDTEPQG